MNNNDDNINYQNDAEINKKIEKQKDHEATKKAVKIVGKSISYAKGGETGKETFDTVADSGLGDKALGLAAKVVEKSPTTAMNVKNFREADESGGLDFIQNAVDAYTNKTPDNNFSNPNVNKNMLKGFNRNNSINNLNYNNNFDQPHQLVTPNVQQSIEEQEYSEDSELYEQQLIEQERQNELEQQYEEELLRQEELNKKKSEKKKENAKKIGELIKKNPKIALILVIAVMILFLVFIFIYMIASDMDLVGTQITSYDQAELIGDANSYCKQISLIKEHDQFPGKAVSSIDDVDLNETFILNKKTVKRWSENTISLEEYVKGVVQAEAIYVKDEKTFEVASIAARTYALQITNSKCHTWDNTNVRTVYRNPQSYTTDTPDTKVKSAVNTTSGIVITLNDKLLNMNNGNYYDYFCTFSSEEKTRDDDEYVFYKMLQKNEKERLLIPIEWANKNVFNTSNKDYTYNKSGKYDKQCQSEGMSLFGAKYLLNKKSDAYTTFRILRYYYGHQTELKTLSPIISSTGCYYWPLSIRGIITSEFGYRVSPTAGASSNHKGIDVGVPEGTPVLATASGTVTKAGAASGYGYAVFIDHGNGLTSEYGHLKADGIKVKVGDNVTQGQIIALSGNTGVSTGPHLHFQIELNGTAVNPLNYVSQDNPSPSCEDLVVPGGNYAGSSKADFIAFIAPFAVNDMHASNILASITIAQAALESGWGTSSLARNYNNYFGVKAIGGWKGSSVNMGTTECEGTRCFSTSANWRIYASPQESIADHSKVLSASRYSGVIGEKNYKTAIQIIKNGGYATDPNYVSKIVSIIENNKLYKYDLM